ncbi:MAG: hypothetical protein GYA21_00975 [Myxococcales bacterium]|nr:hypothetical protein [Myxococcales bacterium]
MRIAAGIILIIAAIINVIAGAGYVLGGGAAKLTSDAVKAVGDEAIKEGAAEDAAKASQELKEATDKAGAAGMGLMGFGLFLWLMFILQIVCAVFCFLAKAKGFIMLVGALSIVAEIVGIILIAFGWTNIFGLLGGLLAIIGAMGIGKAAAPAAPAAPAA